MQIYTIPRPCAAGSSYQITASDGTAPYEFTLLGTPPNPAGLTMTVLNGVATVTIPSGTPMGTPVYVTAADSGSPQQAGTSTNTAS